MKKVLSTYIFGDIKVIYLTDGMRAGFTCVPSDYDESSIKDCAVEPLCELYFTGDIYSTGFADGKTLKHNESSMRFAYVSQDIYKEHQTTEVRTLCRDGFDREYTHVLSYHEGERVVAVKNIFRNDSDKTVSIEYITSFNMGDITPYCKGSGDNLDIHRMRSAWSNEGRIDTESADELMLERSWAGHGVRSEKFGQTGSMPVRGYFPFAAVTDRDAGVTWAASLEAPASWQMEFYRRDNGLSLSGGLADWDFGHWRKNIAEGENFESPSAYITVAHGGLDSVSQRLLTLSKRGYDDSFGDTPLPLVFNEYCTTWGNPSEENITKIIERIKNKGFDYFVIDAGWYRTDWGNSHGDWGIEAERFPNGLMKITDMIAAASMKPGIWYESETCGVQSELYQKTDMLVKRDGVPLTVGARRFLDMRLDKTQKYLDEKVIGLLKKYNFKYMKNDYNEPIGTGIDGAESYGEALRQQTEGSLRFFERIKREIPDIALENCSSGGHRLESSLLSRFYMASFSDAHECTSIPIIAANLHRLMLPAQSQIWAVLRAADSDERLCYSMNAAMLGVMCISGDVYELSDKQWAIIDRGISFYKRIRHIIRNGVSEFFGPKIEKYNSPRGWQAVLRVSDDGNEALAIVHTFEGEHSERVHIPLPEGMRICDSNTAGGRDISVSNGVLSVALPKDFDSAAIYLTK